MATPLGQHGNLGLVSAAVGDRELAGLLEEQRTVARRALRSVLGVCQEEEDLLQEVTVRLLRRLNQSGDFVVSAWTWRVAHNVAVDYIRKHRAVPVEDAYLDRGVGNGLDDEIIASRLDTALRAAMQRLPDRQRDALLVSADLDGGRGRHSVVAARLGVSPKAAESLLARARVALRKELWATGGVVAIVTAAAVLRRALRRKAVVATVLAVAAVTAVIEMRALPVAGAGRPIHPPVGAVTGSRTSTTNAGRPATRGLSETSLHTGVVRPGAVTTGKPQDGAASPSSTPTSQPTGTRPSTPSTVLGLPLVPSPTVPSITVLTVPAVTLPSPPAVTVPTLPVLPIAVVPSVPVPSVPSNITSVLPPPIGRLVSHS